MNKSLITGLVVGGVAGAAAGGDAGNTVKLGYDPGRNIPVENGLRDLIESDDRR